MSYGAIIASWSILPKIGAETLGELKRTISVAGKKRIAAAQRARWAKVKAQQNKAI